MSRLEIERTVVEKGDPDGTLELLPEGPKHLEDLRSNRKSIPSALTYSTPVAFPINTPQNRRRMSTHRGSTGSRGPPSADQSSAILRLLEARP
jgi:hypothetical protein